MPKAGQAYVQPLSLAWRVNHTIPYLIGGTTFLLGSYQYLPSISNYLLGGWLFTIGSTGFLYADLHEWWKNNRIGCAFDEGYEEDFEASVGKHCDSGFSMYGKYQRAENGMNFAFSAVGSLLYLIGSIMFIPDLDLIVEGTIVFIPGSLVIFLSQMWKLYRAGCAPSGPNEGRVYSERRFHLSVLFEDWPAVGVDAGAGLGGFAYCVGSGLFLPGSGAAVTTAAGWFIFGGTCFTISGLFIIYRYFFTLNYAH